MIYLVQQYISRAAKQTPDKVAVACQDEKITYGALDRFTNAFARELRRAGVLRGSFVPFFMKKSCRSIVSLISILKADAAYVPVDFTSPQQRLLSILESTKAKVIIVDDESEPLLRTLLGAEVSVAIVNVSRFEPKEDAALEYGNLSIDVAYTLFTSGSTGTPKGVLIPHKAIIDYIDWCVETYSITADDVVANHAPLYFDNSTFDIYTAFKAGATLQLVHAELNAVLPRLVSWIREREISVFFCVPSVLTLLLKSKRLRADSFPKLRHLIFAGEVVHPGVLAEWMNLFPRVQFTNMYGPTEITVDCTYHVVAQPPGADCTSVPIGKARTNMELFVELSSGELSQQVGAGGQLLVRGTSVAYGYLGDVERTTKAFVQNPGNSVFHDTLYRTGDLVRIDPNGDFLFLGRADDQIKFLGYRIELGEIESALLSLPCVAEGVVVFHASAVQDEQEIGALVRKGSEVSETELIELLRPRLPSYMVPTRIRFATDELPKTASGKYDRKRAAEQVFID